MSAIHQVMLSYGETAPATDPYFASVASLLHMNGANGGTTFTDQKGKTWTPSGGAITTTAFAFFNGSSGSFDGTGDYINTPNHADFQFGTGDFTLEMWIRTPDTSGNIVSMVAAGLGNWALVLVSNVIYWQTSYGATNLMSVASTGLNNNSAHHLVVQRSGGTTVIAWDGVSKVSAADTTNYNGTGAVRVASGTNGDLLANLGELRITKGVARYTFPFTPPNAPFPDS